MLFIQNLPNPTLKVKRSLFHPRMHLPIDKNTPIQIPLRVIAQPFVLVENSLKHLVNSFEIVVVGVVVTVDFVFH